MKQYLILVALLTGCANLTNKSHDFSKYTDGRLCSSAKWVYATHDEELVIKPYLLELTKRNLMTEEQFRSIFKRNAGIGDRACFMYATWGTPTKNNITDTQNSLYNQYVYRSLIDGSSTYVYMQNGVITSINSR